MAGDFVGEDKTDFKPAPENEYGLPGVFLEGKIGCRGRIVVDVRKFLEILEPLEGGDAMVETRFYRYNVFVQGLDNIFRYDNAHSYASHPDAHHKHRFDFQTGEELSHIPAWVGAYRWPHLNAVINEAWSWWLDNRSQLPDPDGFPRLGARK